MMTLLKRHFERRLLVSVKMTIESPQTKMAR